MSFSAEWLALREPVDHASRAKDLAMEVAAHFAGQEVVSVVDLGCGTGSNLRATSLLLPARQKWLLVDYDPQLLIAARTTLSQWAEDATDDGTTLRIMKAGRQIAVTFRQADLSSGAGPVLQGRPSLVTASALFDLISTQWIERFATDVADVGAAFYTVLTYNGLDAFRPSHALDAQVIAAFARHQGGEKGFGPAAGPRAPEALRAGFEKVGYLVREGDSPWQISIPHKALAGDLLRGIAGAVDETGDIDRKNIDAWLEHRLQFVLAPGGRITTGHTDTFAVPA